MELEKNNFIRELSKEQFDGVITNKYKKLFIDYFNGTINDAELTEMVNSNLELINVYENGDNGKIDSNQYLYSAIVDVALNYFNDANSFECCINKMNVLASYFQLVAIAESKLEHLQDLVYDVFFIVGSVTGSGVDEFLDLKIQKIKNIAGTIDPILDEILKHEQLISDVEKETKSSFIDELHIDESVKELYNVFHDSAKRINNEFTEMKEDCVAESFDASIDIMNGTYAVGGAE